MDWRASESRAWRQRQGIPSAVEGAPELVASSSMAVADSTPRIGAREDSGDDGTCRRHGVKALVHSH
nr:unnamed protein product [Digitaria exilis]